MNVPVVQTVRPRKAIVLPAVIALTAALILVGAPGPARASLDPAGELDTTFNTTGYNRTNFAQVDTFAEARAVGIQKPGANAGRIVLAGDYQDGFDSHVALLRLNADGTQDTGFGAGGEVKTTVGANDLINDVAMHFSLGSRRSRCRSPLDHTGSLRPIRVM